MLNSTKRIKRMKKSLNAPDSQQEQRSTTGDNNCHFWTTCGYIGCPVNPTCHVDEVIKEYERHESIFTSQDN
jgi:hypothetical protein